MTETLDTVTIGKKLTLLHDEFPDLKKLDGYWYSNFSNASMDVAQTIRRSDSDIHKMLLLQVYKELHPFEYLESLTYWGMDDMTTYGLMLTKVRYCLGYVGNLKNGEVVTKEHALALIFAYEAYWHYGDDFTLGNNIEFLLRRVGDPMAWEWPSDKDFKYKEERRQYQWLGHTVAVEMKSLARYHGMKSSRIEAFRAEDQPKPVFRDFRVLLAQIKAKAKADSAARNAMKLRLGT